MNAVRPCGRGVPLTTPGVTSPAPAAKAASRASSSAAPAATKQARRRSWSRFQARVAASSSISTEPVATSARISETRWRSASSLCAEIGTTTGPPARSTVGWPAAGALRRTTWALVPPQPNELTPA
jgi:hypothetical protein